MLATVIRPGLMLPEQHCTNTQLTIETWDAFSIKTGWGAWSNSDDIVQSKADSAGWHTTHVYGITDRQQAVVSHGRERWKHGLRF